MDTMGLQPQYKKSNIDFIRGIRSPEAWYPAHRGQGFGTLSKEVGERIEAHFRTLHKAKIRSETNFIRVRLYFPEKHRQYVKKITMFVASLRICLLR